MGTLDPHGGSVAIKLTPPAKLKPKHRCQLTDMSSIFVVLMLVLSSSSMVDSMQPALWKIQTEPKFSKQWDIWFCDFWNNDVLQNNEGVLEEILNTLEQHRSEPPHPDPLPSGEREKSA